MTNNQLDTFWTQAHEQKFLKKKPMYWLQLAQLVGDFSSLQAKEDTSEQLPFDTWWQCCFELLAPLQVRISDIHYLGSESEPEYVEVFNEGPAIVDVSGWGLSAGNENQEFVFPSSFYLQPEQTIKVFTGNGHDLTFGFEKQQIWNNKGDTGRLWNKARQEISSRRYGMTAHDVVEITHIEYDGKEAKTEADEYVKISNKSQSWIDISNWNLTSNRNQTFTFPYKSQIPPYSSIRVYTNQVHPKFGGFSFGSPTAIWNNKGDNAMLSDSTGKTVHRYSY